MTNHPSDISGPEALAAFNQANALVKAGQYEEALAVEMLPSDRKLIEARIVAARANGAHDMNRSIFDRAKENQ